MKKRILTILLLAVALIMVFALTNTVKAADDKFATVEQLGESAVSNITTNTSANVEITYNELDIKWSEAKPDIGRYKNGWWVGVKVNAPDGMSESELQNSKYDNGTAVKSFWDYKDSTSEKHYIGVWVSVDKEMLKTAEETLTIGTYKFDWDNNGTFEQTLTIKVKPTGINLDTNVDGGTKIVTVTIGDKVFSLEEGQTLADLPEYEKELLEQLKTPEEGYKFVGLYKGEEEFDEETAITEDIELEVKFEEEEVVEETPAPESPAPEKADTEDLDDTPKTGIVDVLGYVAIITVVSAMGIAVLNKKH